MKSFHVIVSFLIVFPFFLQSQAPFSLKIEEIDFPDLPALQSFALGITSEGNWLIAGGRTDGLHKRMPFAAFDPDYNNTRLWLIDPESRRIWSAGMTELDIPLQEQLQSSNMEFSQEGNELFLIGGYGYSSVEDEFITHPMLTIIQLDDCAEAIREGTSLAPHISYVTDPRMAVTGGQLEKLGDTFYLVGGQRFEGRYNPQGPDHGPGFFQDYTNEVRLFSLDRTEPETKIRSFSSWKDELVFHRRDFNLVPQIFPDGTTGLTAFSGVFQYDADLPWMNLVNITEGGFQTISGFSQYLNHYHTAHAALYEPGGDMHTLFFGGISQYYINGEGELMSDSQVPFVKTISMVSRDRDGELKEICFPEEMPAYLGASAEFIPHPSAPLFEKDIINLSAIEAGQAVTIGYILGGIESSLPNVFFENGDLSKASSRLFRVQLRMKMATQVYELEEEGPAISLEVTGASSNGMLIARVHSDRGKQLTFFLQDSSGRLLDRWQAEIPSAGTYEIPLNTGNTNKGMFWLTVSNGTAMDTASFLITK